MNKLFMLISNISTRYAFLYVSRKKGNNMWVVHYRPDKVSQPWSVLGSFDEKVDAIIKAYQVSSEYFMIKVIGPDGSIIWSS